MRVQLKTSFREITFNDSLLQGTTRKRKILRQADSQKSNAVRLSHGQVTFQLFHCSAHQDSVSNTTQTAF